jgi:hypothetical protein
MGKEKEIIRPEEEPSGLVPCKPKDQVFQRLCLCNYLKELPEVAEEKDGGFIDFRRPQPGDR